MNSLAAFSLPTGGMRPGQHTFDFTLQDAFFAAFPDSPVSQVEIEVSVTVDKRASHITIDIAFDGTVRTQCDRCLADIDLPIVSDERLVIKYSSEGIQREEEADVVYIDLGQPTFQLAPYLYEYTILAIPMVKRIDCDPEADQSPCDQTMLSRLEGAMDTEVEESSMAAQLKKLFSDN